MTVFTPLADRIGKNLSEKKIITAMEEELGGVENAIEDKTIPWGERNSITLDEAIDYAMEGLEDLDKRMLSHVSDERIRELACIAASNFEYLAEEKSPEASNDKENIMKSSETTSDSKPVPNAIIAEVSFGEFTTALFEFANHWVGSIAVDRLAMNAENYYRDNTIVTLVWKYWQACLNEESNKRRMFDSIVGGQDIYDATSWDNSIYRNEVQAYGDVLYDLLVKLPEQREKNLEITK